MTAIAPAAAPSPSPSAPAAAEAAPIVAPVPNPAETAAPTEAEALASFDITKYTDTQVAELESGDPERIAKVLGSTAQTADAKPAAEAKPNPETPPEHADNGETKARISIKSLKPEDRAKMVQAMEAVRGGKSPAEALADAFGISTAAPAAPADESTPATPPAAEVVAPHPKVAAIEAQVAAKQAELAKAKLTFDPAKDDLLEELQDLKLDLRDARREAAIEAQKQAAHAEYATTWEAAQAESHARSMSKFSDLITDPEANGDDGFLTRCNYEIYLAEQRKDPILAQADWPEKIGQKVFDKFFKGKAANSADPDANESPSVPPAPKQTVRLPGSPAGIGTAAGGLSLEAAEAEFAKLPWDQRLDALGKIEAATKRR